MSCWVYEKSKFQFKLSNYYNLNLSDRVTSSKNNSIYGERAHFIAFHILIFLFMLANIAELRE